MANVEQEAKELEAVPKVPIHKFLGSHKRCHICGKVIATESLKPFDTHIRGSNRLACAACHPKRGRNG